MTKVYFMGTFWRERRAPQPSVLIDGANFGEKPGQVSIQLNLKRLNGGRSLATVTSRIIAWHDGYIEASVDGLDDVRMVEAFKTALHEKVTDRRRSMVIALTTVVRSDDSQSRWWYQEVPELHNWLWEQAAAK